MTPMKLTAAEANRLICEKVFGWRWESYGNGGGFWHRDGCEKRQRSSSCKCGGLWYTPDYLSDPAASKALMNKLAQMENCHLELWVFSTHAECAIAKEVPADPFGTIESVVADASGDTLERAVALCAFASLGLDVEIGE